MLSLTHTLSLSLSYPLCLHFPWTARGHQFLATLGSLFTFLVLHTSLCVLSQTADISSPLSSTQPLSHSTHHPSPRVQSASQSVKPIPSGQSQLSKTSTIQSKGSVGKPKVYSTILKKKPFHSTKKPTNEKKGKLPNESKGQAPNQRGGHGSVSTVCVMSMSVE